MSAEETAKDFANWIYDKGFVFTEGVRIGRTWHQDNNPKGYSTNDLWAKYQRSKIKTPTGGTNAGCLME